MKTKIVVAGYPKSGNTWLNRLLADVIDCPQAGYLEKGKEYPEIAKEGHDRKSPYEVWKTHSSFPSIKDNENVNLNNVVYIVRDPRDVAISSSHYFSHNLNQCIEMMNSGELAKKAVNFRSWNEHVKEWIESSVHVVKYENLLSDTFSEVKKILKYLDLSETEISDDHIRKSVEKQSFAKRKNTSNINRGFLRKGKSKQYKTDMSHEQRKKCMSYFIENIKKLGYEH